MKEVKRVVEIYEVAQGISTDTCDPGQESVGSGEDGRRKSTQTTLSS